MIVSHLCLLKTCCDSFLHYLNLIGFSCRRPRVLNQIGLSFRRLWVPNLIGLSFSRPWAPNLIGLSFRRPFWFLSLFSFIWIGGQFPVDNFLSYRRILTLHYCLLIFWCVLRCVLSLSIFALSHTSYYYSIIWVFGPEGLGFRVQGSGLNPKPV